MRNEISIVIPVFNRGNMICDVLNCVSKQTYRPIHLVLVDNNSFDNTLEILNQFKSDNETSDFRITVVEEPRQGAAIARNTGARYVESEWLMFFDSDDKMDFDLVEKYVQSINSADSDLIIVDADYEIGSMKKEFFNVNDNFLENQTVHGFLSTVRFIVKKALFDKIDGWNESLHGWDDWEFGVRLLLDDPKVQRITDSVPVHVKVHKNSISGDNFSSKHEWWESAVDEVEKAIKNSMNQNKEKLLKLVEFRRILLAGNYYKENKFKLAHELYASTYARVKQDKVMSWLYPLVYRYIGMGGRGAGRLVKKIVK